MNRFFCLAVILVIICTSCNIAEGVDNPEYLGEAYIMALKNSNKKDISVLVAPDYEFQSIVQEKIAAFEGKENKSLFAEARFPITPYFGFIVLRDEQGNIYDEIPCENIGGRWYLILGKHKNHDSGELETIDGPP